MQLETNTLYSHGQKGEVFFLEKVHRETMKLHHRLAYPKHVTFGKGAIF